MAIIGLLHQRANCPRDSAQTELPETGLSERLQRVTSGLGLFQQYVRFSLNAPNNGLSATGPTPAIRVSRSDFHLWRISDLKRLPSPRCRKI
jgi:hypothetical protein